MDRAVAGSVLGSPELSSSKSVAVGSGRVEVSSSSMICTGRPDGA